MAEGGPLGRLLALLEARTGLAAGLRALGATPCPGPPSFKRATGGVFLGLVALQLLSGMTLAHFYAPSSTTAWGSVFFIEEQVLLGSFVRGLHAFGASALVVLALLHLLSVGLRRAYLAPRELAWTLGLLGAPILAGFSLTGYLLPWDQKGYWATQVATGIMRGTPGVGGWAATTFQGGPELGSLTLTRFYALHTAVLPLVLILFLLVLVQVWRRAARALADAGEANTPYWPGQAFRDLLALLAVVGLVALLAASEGAGLEAPADPDSDYPPRPEWYFAPLRELLKTVPEPYGSVLLPGAVLALLVSLPWLDGGRRAKVARWALLAPILLWGTLLGITSWADRIDADFQARRERAGEDAALARRLAREGIPGDGAGEMLRRHPPRWGRRLFVLHCQNCHRVDGVGDAEGPDLTGYLSRAWLRGVIVNPQDPRFFGNTELATMEALPREAWGDADAMAAFLQAQDPARAPAIPAALVEAGRKAYFAHDCHTCHMLAPGEADLGPNLAGYGSAPWLRAFLVDPGHELYYAEDNAMPAYGDELSGEELDALVAYLQSLAGETP